MYGKDSMNMLIKKVVLVIFAAGICSTVSAQSMRWAGSGAEYCRKLSDSVYVPINSDGSLGMASYKIKNNKIWLITGEISEYRGYYTHSKGEYTYYDRNDNTVGSYVASQGRYYMHSSQGNTILKSTPYAVLSKGVLIPGNDAPARYTVDKGFDPIVVGLVLLVY